MDAATDLTLFWRAWQKTCSVRLCCVGHEREYRERCASVPELCERMEEVQALAKGVIVSMNKRLAALLKKGAAGTRLSDLSADFGGERPSVQALGSAFELIELHLYGRASLNGKQFKAYLFEDVAGRPGGMNRNLFGYLQRVLSTVVAESYGENVYQSVRDEDGNDQEPPTISTDGFHPVAALPTADECAEAHEVEDFFRAYLSEHASVWTSDHWLVLYCVLNMLRVGAADVRPLFSKGHQTINVYAAQMRGDLLRRLREAFSDKAIGLALMGPLQDILDERVCREAWHPRARKILEENRQSTGK